MMKEALSEELRQGAEDIKKYGDVIMLHNSRVESSVGSKICELPAPLTLRPPPPRRLSRAQANGRYRPGQNRKDIF